MPSDSQLIQLEGELYSFEGRLYELPVHCSGHGRGQAAAGVQPTVAISNQGPEGSLFVVEQLVLRSGSGSMECEVSRSGRLTADVPASSRFLADTTAEARPGATGRDVPVRVDVHIAGVTITTVGSLCEVVGVTASPSTVLPVRHYLRKNEVCFVKLYTVATQLTVGVSGRFFLPLTPG